MIAADLLVSLDWSHGVAPASIDPLTNVDVLAEAQVMDLRFDAVHGVLGVLLELRLALQLHEANTGILIATGVEEVQWTAEPRATKLTAWNVVSSGVEQSAGDLVLALGCMPEATLRVRASSLTYANCQVSGLGVAPPDYGDESRQVQASLAAWHSEVTVVSVVSRQPDGLATLQDLTTYEEFEAVFDRLLLTVAAGFGSEHGIEHSGHEPLPLIDWTRLRNGNRVIVAENASHDRQLSIKVLEPGLVAVARSERGVPDGWGRQMSTQQAMEWALSRAIDPLCRAAAQRRWLAAHSQPYVPTPGAAANQEFAALKDEETARLLGIVDL